MDSKRGAVIGNITELLTPPVITGLVAVFLLVPPAVWALLRQHSHWQRAEREASQALYTRDAVQAALETAPEGYFAWFRQSISKDGKDKADLPEFRTEGYCSRRLAVLLDLFRGMESSFEDILDGFDHPSQDKLRSAVATIRDDGTGFEIELNHTTTGRRIQARGIRALDESSRTMADVIWMNDITEGVAAVDTLTEESIALRRERNLLKAALSGVAHPVWLRDDDLSLIYCNDAYVQAVDAQDAPDVVARGREIAPRVAVREVRALAAAARASSETRRAPFHMVIDGSRRLMEVIESPIDSYDNEATQETPAPLFSDGSGRMTAGTAYDITLQEELEIRLKREAAAHAEVLERLGTAIAIFGPDSRLIFFNTAFAELWDLNLDWLKDGPTYATVLDALRAERRLPEVADFPAYKDKELARFTSLLEPTEDVLHLPGGATLRRVIAPHPMGGLLTTYEDITDRLALERSYNTLIAVQRETIDNLQEAVAVFGAEGELRIANPAFADLWDLDLETLREGPIMGDVIDAFKKYFDDTTVWSRHRTVMLAALDSDKQRTAQQGRVIRADQSVLEFISVPLPDGGVLFCYNDVSAPERVAQTLRGRAEALTATDKLRTEFLANVAFELEGPVLGIGGLAKRLASIKPGQPAAVVQDIINASNTLKALIEDVRDLSGVETGQQTLHLDSFDIADVMKRVSTITRESVKRHGAILEITCAKDIGWMVGDAARIKQTLYHLLMGALKNVPDGESIVLSAQRSENSKNHVTFSISHAAYEQMQTSLGVYLAQRIAELHGGSITTNTDDTQMLVAFHLPTGGSTNPNKTLAVDQ